MPDHETLLNLQQDEREVAVFLAEHGGALDTAEAGAGVYWTTQSPRSARASPTPGASRLSGTSTTACLSASRVDSSLRASTRACGSSSSGGRGRR